MLTCEQQFRPDCPSLFLGQGIDDGTQFELRTSLNAVIGLLHAALDDELIPRQRQRLGEVLSAGYSIVGLLDACVMSGEVCEFSLEDVFSHLRFEFGSVCTAKGLTFGFLPANDMPALLCGDPRLLVTVLGRMLRAAIDSTACGGVVLQVFRGFRRMDGKILLKFEVLDTGSEYPALAGSDIAPEDWQAIVERQGGRAGTLPGNATSGGVRWLELPFSEGGMVQRTASLGGLHILLADDNELHRDAERCLLESAGANVVVANDGEEAIASYCKADVRNRFDCILLDLQMPKMDGIETACRLRAMGTTAPIVAVSANIEATMRARCEAVGMDAFLAKPVLPRMLESVLGRLLVRPPEHDCDQSLQAARSAMGVDEVYWRRLLELFLETTKRDMGEMVRAAINSDWAAVGKYAHRIAGGSRIVGLNGVAGELFLIDQFARAGQYSSARQLLEIVDHSLADAVSLVQRELVCLPN